MTTGDQFTDRLVGFGLSEKEAQTYLHLLKFGPKTPSRLVNALHTYREDVHRTLKSLIDKGMVRPSLNSPTTYAAVDLETALESTLKEQESELREMELRRMELQELAKRQQFGLSDEGAKFKILKSIREVLNTALPVILSAKEEFLWVSNRQGVEVGEIFGIVDATKEFIERGGQCRGIADVTYRLTGIIRHHLDIGADVRHFAGYRGAYYGVFDKKHCFSAINVDVSTLKLDEPLSMLYTNDPVYADYLIKTFDLLWKNSVPAEQTIQELVKQGPPKA
ncbi:MAG: TrmB family transcriptional regulator [Halobacteriota archaeon]